MSHTTKHKLIGKYNRALYLWQRGNYSWLNWHPYCLNISHTYVGAQVTDVIKIDGKLFKFGTPRDGHEIALLNLKPKYPFKYCKYYSKRPKHWNTVMYARPIRRKLKNRLKRFFSDEFDLGAGFDYTKPQHYFD